MITAGQRTAARVAGVALALFEIFTSVWLLTKGLNDVAYQ